MIPEVLIIYLIKKRNKTSFDLQYRTPNLGLLSVSVSDHGMLRVCYDGPRADPRLTQSRLRKRTRFQKKALISLLKNVSGCVVEIYKERGLQAVRKKTGVLQTYVRNADTKGWSEETANGPSANPEQTKFFFYFNQFWRLLGCVWSAK